MLKLYYIIFPLTITIFFRSIKLPKKGKKSPGNSSKPSNPVRSKSTDKKKDDDDDDDDDDDIYDTDDEDENDKDDVNDRNEKKISMDREKSRKSVDKPQGVGNTANPPMKSSNSNKMDDVSRLMMALNESLEGVLSNSTRKALIEYLKVTRLKYFICFFII